MRWQKATPTEAQFQKAVIELAELHGWLVFHAPDGEHNKRQNRTAKGFPDLVLVNEARGLLRFAELKTDDGKTTPEQDAWRNAIEECGTDAEVWRPRHWATIEAMLTGANDGWLCE